ncbi:MAG: flagellar motor switch protein FliM, partial [Firmicutes bacterium]|nr:flagellar motor switch protein FliM [Bacillota bacterium]
MREVLSQAEVDQVLAAISAGGIQAEGKEQSGVSEGDIRYYDFRLPNKFSKEQLRTLQMLHDNFSRLLSSFLSGYLRTNVHLRVSTVEQLTYDDFVRSIPTPIVITVFSMKPLKGKAIMVLNPQFLFPVIDLLFGGPGLMPKRIRHFTDIELSVIRRLNVKILENLAFAWGDVYSVTPEIESIETNPLLHQIVQPNEIVALLTFDGIIGNSGSGIITICFPYILLEPFISQMATQYRFLDTSLHDTEEAKNITYWVNQTEVELITVAGEANITVQDFLQLQVGDVLMLDKRVGRDLDLYVGEKLKFKVQAGTVGQYLGVQVV